MVLIIKNSEEIQRKSAKGDDSNLSVLVFGVKANIWLKILVLVEFVTGIAYLTYYICNRVQDGKEKTTTGIFQFIWVTIYCLSICCASKTCFSLLGCVVLFTTFIDWYTLFVRFLIITDQTTTENFIFFCFSIIDSFYALFTLIVIFRASWCNGLGNEHDLEMHAIVDIIQERINTTQCSDCDDREYLATFSRISSNSEYHCSSADSTNSAKNK